MIHTYDIETELVAPTKSHYNFNGWFKKQDCSDASVDKIQPRETTDDITLYAKWTSEQYSITYKDQWGSPLSRNLETNTPTKHTYDVTTDLVVATRRGFKFGGWYKNQNCTGKTVDKINAKEITGDITLYTKWTECEYTIHYDANHGEGEAMGTQTQKFSENVTLFPNKFTRTGYSFISWGKDKDGISGRYAAGDTVSGVSDTDGDVTLYAIWKKEKNYINSNDNFVIDDVEYDYTALTSVIKEETTIDGSDDNWKSYCDPSAPNQY